MLVAALLDHAEALQVVAAALRGTVALVPLDHPPEERSAHVIELQAPGLALPIVLLGRLEGEAVAGMYPLRLKPLSASHASDLRAFLRGGGVAPPVTEGLVDEEPQGPGDDGLYRIGARREPPVVIPPAPDGTVREPLLTVDPDAERARDAGPLEMVFGAPVRAASPPAPATPAAGPGHSPDEERTIQQGKPDEERSFAGRVLAGGKYLVQSHIGSGGAGRVYRGYHRELETTIAIKLLHELHRADGRFTARFKREARATSQLDHPNVMRVLDFGREDDGTMYIVMEFLDGPNLQRIIDIEAPVELPRLVGIMSQVCAALSAAHHIGIIHRDMKPENVVVMQRRDDDGSLIDVVKVCDFGLAKIQESTKRDRRKSSANLTIAGTVWGTPEYMSPEQIRDELLDPRSDVYACGVILYEMATGQLPFMGETAIDIVTKHVIAEPEPPSRLVADLDPGLEATILKALRKNPDERQQSARELRAELRALLDPAARSASGSGWQPASSPMNEPGVFEDSVAKTTPHLKVSALADDIVDRVARRGSAASVEQVLDTEGTVRAGGALDLALAILARQGNANALWTLVEFLDRVARDPEAEAEPRQRAIATRSLQTISDPDTLAEIARQFLAGSPEQHEAARDVLWTLGAAGAQALCNARLAMAAPVPQAARGRFVEVVRDMGAGAVSALGVTLSQLDPARADAEPHLVEDLLRALPPDSSELVAQLVLRHVRSRSPGVRRAAVEALALVLGSHARAALRSLIEDADVAIRIAAFAGLRRIGSVDEKVVQEVGRILSESSDEALASTAAAALAAVEDAARPAAVAVLSRAIEPTSRVARLVGTAGPRLSDLVVETVARTLVAIGGLSGRVAVERRIAHEKDPLRSRLFAVIGGG